jgi:hypothetical protein
MKIFIGITQDVDAAKKIIAARYKDLGTSTEAGPFKTRAEALNWQDFMMKRKDDYEEIKTLSSSASEAYWFGITVESSQIH